jgi:hypothetical protein
LVLCDQMLDQRILLYKEQQRFNQFWLWMILLAASSIFWAGFFYQVILKAEFGNNPASDVQLTILFVLIGIALPYFFYSIKLITEVQPGEIRVRMWPFHRRPVIIPLHSVYNFEIITYSPIKDYGGWGIRWGMKGKAYNMSGNKGVLLSFYNSRPLLIGSQNPKEFAEAIKLARDLKPEL